MTKKFDTTAKLATSGTVYDCSEEANGSVHLVEPFLQATFEQPSVTLKIISKSAGCKLRTVCYDLVLRSFDSHEKVLSGVKPFLPAKENFNIVWIETREGDVGANGIPPALYTLTISDFLTPKRAKTELNIERPLKVILDLIKLRIGRKCLRKLMREFHFESLLNKPLVRTKSSVL